MIWRREGGTSQRRRSRARNRGGLTLTLLGFAEGIFLGYLLLEQLLESQKVVWRVGEGTAQSRG